MKTLIMILRSIGWLDFPKIQPAQSFKAEIEPEEIGKLWGIPGLYDEFPDLIGK